MEYVIARRDFLKLLGVAAGAAIAAQLPIADEAVALPVEAPTLPKGWNGVVLWINGRPYAVHSASVSRDPQYVDVTSFVADELELATYNKLYVFSVVIEGYDTNLVDEFASRSELKCLFKAKDGELRFAGHASEHSTCFYGDGRFRTSIAIRPSLNEYGDAFMWSAA